MKIALTEPGAIRLQNELAGLGFCFSAEEYRQLMAHLPCRLTDFTNAVFKAEKMDPDFADRHLWRRVRDAILEAQRKSEN